MTEPALTPDEISDLSNIARKLGDGNLLRCPICRSTIGFHDAQRGIADGAAVLRIVCARCGYHMAFDATILTAVEWP